MVAKKSKSKRVSLQQKYKIQKRTKEHHKRLKKGRLSIGSKKKKEDGNFIPNSWPYKEDLLKQIQTAKERMEEMKIRQKEKRHEEIMKKRMNSSGSAVMEIETPTITAEEAAAALSNDVDDNHMEDEDNDINHSNLGQNSRRAYLKELKKVVEQADVILHVLDARDPAGTRSSAIENMVLSKSRKKLVYVLNKADLVPRDVLAGWLSYLRKLNPTVPFKCNTQSQSGNLGRASGKVGKVHENTLQSSQAVGAEELLSLLKNYCRVGDSKSIISVGIVGFPNTGKSSLINSLLRTRAVGVSSMPGFTKVSQEVILDKNIRLIDSPGVVFADGDSAATALRNCVNVEELEDFMTPIQAILDRCPQPYLMQLYMIPKFKNKDAMGFLALVAKMTGRLKKGGIPNIDAAARAVLHDWNDGKIKFYCKPPANATNSGIEESSKIVQQFSPELQVSELKDEDIKVLDVLESQRESNSSYIAMDEVANRIDIHIGDEESSMAESSNMREKTSSKLSEKHLSSIRNDEMGEDDAKTTYTSATRKSNVQSDSRLETVIDEKSVGVDIRKVQKKMKKKDQKLQKRSNSVPDASYDFEQDYEY